MSSQSSWNEQQPGKRKKRKESDDGGKDDGRKGKLSGEEKVKKKNRKLKLVTWFRSLKESKEKRIRRK